MTSDLIRTLDRLTWIAFPKLPVWSMFSSCGFVRCCLSERRSHTLQEGSNLLVESRSYGITQLMYSSCLQKQSPSIPRSSLLQRFSEQILKTGKLFQSCSLEGPWHQPWRLDYCPGSDLRGRFMCFCCCCATLNSDSFVCTCRETVKPPFFFCLSH